MLKNFMQKIEGLNPWHFLCIGILFSEFFTFIMNSILSVLWWDYISIDLLLIGSIDAFIVAFIVSTIIIYFVNKIKETKISNQKLIKEVKTLRGILQIGFNWKKIQVRANSRLIITPSCLKIG